MENNNQGVLSPQNADNGNQNGNPNPNGTISAPEGWISPAELESLLRKVRKEEKDKLYSKITQLEEANRSLQETNSSLEQQVRELQSKGSSETDSLVKEIEALKSQIAELTKGDKAVTNQPNNQPGTNSNQAQNPEVEALKAQLAETQETLKKMNEFVANLQQQTQAQQVQALRQSLIAQKASDLPAAVHFMITGNTPEEIEKSIENARQFYQAVYQEASKNVVAVPSSNPAGDIKLPGELTVEQIQNMTLDQWAEWRQKIGLR